MMPDGLILCTALCEQQNGKMYIMICNFVMDGGNGVCMGRWKHRKWMHRK